MAKTKIKKSNKKFSFKFHVGIILVLFALITFLHYSEQIGLPWSIPPSFHFGLTRHVFDRILFLIPIIYAGHTLGAIMGYSSCFAALVIMLPRVIAISPAPKDSLLETLSVILVGILATILFWRRALEKKRLFSALVESQTTSELLKHYNRAAGSLETLQDSGLAKSPADESQLRAIQEQLEELSLRIKAIDERKDGTDRDVARNVHIEGRLKSLEDVVLRIDKQIGEYLGHPLKSDEKPAPK